MNRWHIDFNSKTPLYLQIRDLIKASILANELIIGSKLSQRTVAKLFNVSRMPVVEAFDILEAEGFLESHPRSGVVVTKHLWSNSSQEYPSVWQNYLTSGSHLRVPENISKILDKLEKPDSVKINADNIASSFISNDIISNSVRRVAARIESSTDLEYTNCTGLLSLKKTLVKHMSRYGIETSEENIIIMSGVGEAVAWIAAAFLASSMCFLYEKPSHINSMLFVRSTGINMDGIAMDDEGIILEQLISKIKRRKDSVLYTQMLNHNPTGITTSHARRSAILSVCKQYHVPIIENDMERDLAIDLDSPKPLKASDTNGQVIYIGSLWSGVMGLKTSWVVAPSFAIERLKDLKRHTESPFNNIAEMITDDLISSGVYYDYMDQLRVKVLDQYRKITKLLDEYLSDIAQWSKASPSQFIWLKLDESVDLSMAEEVENDCLFIQGCVFDWKDTEHIRLNVLSTEPEMLEEWIIRISQLLRRCVRQKTVAT